MTYGVKYNKKSTHWLKPSTQWGAVWLNEDETGYVTRKLAKRFHNRKDAECSCTEVWDRVEILDR